jgi:hypothetical protein
MTLKSLGFVIQLGHAGSHCPCPSMCYSDFVVLDISGLHTVNVRFCECPNVDGGLHTRFQLLRFGWFPSTVTRPKSAFTFDVLDTFHLLTLQGKTSVYDFYYTMAHKSDNTGLLQMKVSRTVCIICYLKFALGSLSTVSDCHPHLAPSQIVKVDRTWPRSCWCGRDGSRAMRHRMPSMSSTWPKPSAGLGERPIPNKVCSLF